MKRFLLTTAAVVTLALAVPMAVAQNTTNQPTYTQTTPPAGDAQSTVGELSTETEAVPSMTTPDTMTPSVEAGPNSYSYDQVDRTTTAQAHSSEMDENVDQMASTTDVPQYVAQSDQYANYIIEPATLQEAALAAGMAGTPMNAADVCATREVDLGSSRFTHAARQQLRFAADRASACEIDQVVVSAPRGRDQAVRQVLLDQGIDAADIEVQEASELGVEMRFAGVATSSDYYASLFNPNQQLALNDAAPGSSYASPDQSKTLDEPMMQPDASAPENTDPDPAQDTTL